MNCKLPLRPHRAVSIAVPMPCGVSERAYRRTATVPRNLKTIPLSMILFPDYFVMLPRLADLLGREVDAVLVVRRHEAPAHSGRLLLLLNQTLLP